MARILTAGMSTAIQKQFTNPVLLVNVDFGAQVNYYSSREQITYVSNNYLKDLMEVVSVNNDELQFSLNNNLGATSVLLLNNRVGGNAVNAFLHYEGETKVRFAGIFDDWETIEDGQRVLCTATSLAAKAARFPEERIEHGVFNHLPQPGVEIPWASDTIILVGEP